MVVLAKLLLEDIGVVIEIAIELVDVGAVFVRLAHLLFFIRVSTELI